MKTSLLNFQPGFAGIYCFDSLKTLMAGTSPAIS
jgi:hypothetical protein